MRVAQESEDSLPHNISLPKGFALWSEPLREKWLQDNSLRDKPAERRAYKPEAWRPGMTFQEFRREVWSPTDPSKTYVIAKMHVEFGIKRSNRMLYLCLSKTRRATKRGAAAKQYWGLYIGTQGKRYGAERFAGGAELDRLLALNGNRDLVAVEVKA